MGGIFKNGIWSCGFDFLPDGTPTVGGVFTTVTGGSIGAANARYSGKGINFNGGNTNNGAVSRTFGTTLTQFYTGVAIKAGNLPDPTFVENLVTVGSGLFNLGWASTGQVGLFTGGQTGSPGSGTLVPGTSLTAASLVVPSVYNFFELFVSHSVSAGQAIVRFNNSTILSFSGINTGASSDRMYLGNQVSGGTTGHNVSFDDWYILDGTGAVPNNQFLGNGRIQTDAPIGDSLTPGLSQWAFTTPSGSQWQNAGNIPANAARFNTGTLGQRMMFRFPTIVASRVFFLNTWLSAQEDVAGTCGITPVFRSNGADQLAAEIPLATPFSYFNQNSIIDPNTGLPWYSEQASIAGAAELGVTRTS